jgi:kynurenine formamidase
MTEVVSERTLGDWSARYSNWGRWGPEDQRGTLNFITGEHIRSACTLPRSGLTICCALPYADDRSAPLLRNDPIETGWTSLSHVAFDGRSYNDRTVGDGAPPAIAFASDRVVGRGVLLDLPRYTRLPWLDDGTRITPNDLDLCAEAFGVTVERGDIVLVRTGGIAHCRSERSWSDYRSGPAPGLTARCARWIFEREIAALATDTFELGVRPGDAACDRPLDRISVRDTGLLVGGAFDLDRLSLACAQDGNYAFLFVAPPLPEVKAGRARTNPIAIK